MTEKNEQASVTIVLPEGKGEEILDIFNWIDGPTRCQPGIVSVRLCQDHKNQRRLRFITQWQSREALEGYLRTKYFAAILNAVELSEALPEIHFETLTNRRGLNYIHQVLEGMNLISTGSSSPGEEKRRAHEKKSRKENG